MKQYQPEYAYKNTQVWKMRSLIIALCSCFVGLTDSVTLSKHFPDLLETTDKGYGYLDRYSNILKFMAGLGPNTEWIGHLSMDDPNRERPFRSLDFYKSLGNIMHKLKEKRSLLRKHSQMRKHYGSMENAYSGTSLCRRLLKKYADRILDSIIDGPISFEQWEEESKLIESILNFKKIEIFKFQIVLCIFI